MHVKINNKSQNQKDQRPYGLPARLSLSEKKPKVSKEQIREEIKEAYQSSVKPAQVDAVESQDHPEAESLKKIRKPIRRRDDSKKLDEYGDHTQTKKRYALKKKNDKLDDILEERPSSPAYPPAVVPVNCLSNQSQRRDEENKFASPSKSIDEHKDESSLKLQDLKHIPSLDELQPAPESINQQAAASLHFSQFDQDKGFVVSIEGLSREQKPMGSLKAMRRANVSQIVIRQAEIGLDDVGLKKNLSDAVKSEDQKSIYFKYADESDEEEQKGSIRQVPSNVIGEGYQP